MFSKSILAGIFIGMATIFSRSIGGILGALLFSVGIIGVLELELKLVTGEFGKRTKSRDLLVVLLGNVIGASLLGLWYFRDINIFLDFQINYLDLLVGSILCGLCIYAAVKAHRPWVPLFIACFAIHEWPHCVVKAFYINNLNLVEWVLVIFGNFLGGRVIARTICDAE